jgi:SAM-dependent methyltransferase
MSRCDAAVAKRARRALAWGEVTSLADRNNAMDLARWTAAYRFCAPRCKDCSVLEIGCGEGYGAHLLSRWAEHVTGVDAKPALVQQASQRFGWARLSFRVADALGLPFADGTFERVVSLQCIEHVDDCDRFVAEASRVLKVGGEFLCVTPNVERLSRIKNPYHKKEFSPAEFRQLLERHFASVRIAGVHGSPGYTCCKRLERGIANIAAAVDVLGFHHRLPVRVRKALFYVALKLVHAFVERFRVRSSISAEPAEFPIRYDNLSDAFDLVGICTR